MLAEVCACLGDARHAATLYKLLLPYAGRTATAVAGICLGSCAHYLGRLAATIPLWQDAERHFEDALQTHARMGTRPLLAYTQRDYAAMLLARGDAGDRERAFTLVSAALDTAKEFGMKALVEKAVAVKLRAQGLGQLALESSVEAVASTVARERPDLREHAAPDGTVTVVFTDIEGSSLLTERLGDERWIALLRTHNAIVREQVAAHRGFEVKSQGDGFMVVFPGARRALRFAIAVQRRLWEHCRQHPDRALRVRLGLHAGEAVRDKADFFGKTVVLAARIAGEAQGSEILVSSLIKALTESTGEFCFEGGREVVLKGLAGRHSLYGVRWAEDAQAHREA
jgi:class 3 adenylate cyclase